MRCSSTAGFHGRSMFSTTEACCRFSPTPPASVDRNARQLRIVAEAIHQVLALRPRNAAVEQDVLPLPALEPPPQQLVHAEPLAEHHRLGARPLEQLVQQLDRLVRLLALVGLRDRGGSCCRRTCACSAARSSAAAGRPPTGSGSAAISARCGRRSPCSRCDTSVAGPSSARRRCCRSVRAAGPAPRPCGGAAGSAPASGRCGPGRCSRPPCRPGRAPDVRAAGGTSVPDDSDPRTGRWRSAPPGGSPAACRSGRRRRGRRSS